MKFFVTVARFHLRSGDEQSTNAFRGALGALLYKRPPLYEKWFDPRWEQGPSGYRNAPRPFVLRQSGSALELILFAKDSLVFENALAQALGPEAQQTDRSEFELPLSGSEKEGFLRVEFVTPTAWKEKGAIATQPVFDSLIDRIAERTWALGRLHQNWPAQDDLRARLAGAWEVQLRCYQWQRDKGGRRLSARSSVEHDLRGFTGWAEYEGPLGRFVPLLEIASWTGVGRHTVWGNGQIRIADFAERTAG